MAKSSLQSTIYNLQSREAKLLAQGAEAKIFQNKNIIIKSRIPKTYRHPTLDRKLRTHRTKSEAKILAKCAEAKINIPKLIHAHATINPFTKKPIADFSALVIEFLPGERLSQTLSDKPLQQQVSIIKKLATQIKKLHNTNIIHADLTTSNTILLNNKVYLIDFGLSYISTKTEDKAVDLYLLKKALQAKHHKTATRLFQNFLKTYNNQEIINRLKIVETRGRYKH